MTAPPLRTGLSRSPGQMLLSTSPGEVGLGGSPSGQSSSSMLSSSNASTPSHLPRGLRRRSTDTTSLDEYYFSSLAGVGASSSTSSLAMSPENGALAFGNSPAPSVVDLSRGPSSQGQVQGQAQGQGTRNGNRSHASLGDLINQEEESMSSSPTDYLSTLPRPPFSHHATSDSDQQASAADPGPSNRGIHVVPYPSDQSVPRVSPRKDSGMTEASASVSVDDERSPGGYSQSSASHYSSSELSSDNESFGFDVDGGALRGLLGPEAEREWGRSGSRIEVRESVDSSITVMDNHATPMPTEHKERFDIHPPNLSYPDPHQSHSPRNRSHHTDSTTSPKNDRTPTIGGPVISSSRLGFVSPADASKRSLHALQSDVTASDSSERVGLVVTARSDANGNVSATSNDSVPKSAPPTQGDFGEIKEENEDGEDTIKGRNRMTLPASASASIFSERVTTPDKEAPRRDSLTVRDANASPNKSPQPPPRSTLRPHPSLPSSSPSLSRVSSEHPISSPLVPTPSTTDSVSPRTRNKALPTIVNTESSPQAHDVASRTGPKRPDRSPTRSVDSFHSSATINDLTEMLGGAIDAIGLIDSRDTPPPSVTEPPKKDRGLSVPTLSAPAELIDPPDQITTLPARGASLPGNGLAYQHPSRSQTQPVQRQSSGHSVHSAYGANTTPGIPTARPWPAAMVYGNIKGLRNPGDRAKAYAKAINEIAKAESGLKEWCIASVQYAHRPAARPVKASAIHGLGFRAPTQSTLVPEPAHPRSVSSSSEFPMRADSYAAREISTRMIDPHDQPTALPQNLPYPQLQQQYANPALGGGMRASPSMQSMASVSSKKGFFSAAIGRMGGSRKESFSLGPPSGNYIPPGSTAKKDVRGLPISSPSYGSSDGVPTPRVQGSISAPLGPRTQRGSYTPPPGTLPDRSSVDVPSRVNLDQGLARMAPSLPSAARASIDSNRPMNKMSAPPVRSSPMASQVATFGSPGVKEEDVRQMADVLPHVERSVLRIYLQKHQEPMRAIGAYLEDEKRGTIVR